MRKVSEIEQFLCELFPLALAESWDNVGLLIGRRSALVNKVMTCLTLSPDVVEEACAEGVGSKGASQFAQLDQLMQAHAHQLPSQSETHDVELQHSDQRTEPQVHQRASKWAALLAAPLGCWERKGKSKGVHR